MVLCWSRSSVVTECFLSSWCLLLTRFTSIEGGRIVSTSSVEDVFFSSSYKILKVHLIIRMPSIHFSCAQSYCLLSLLCLKLHGLAYLFKWENQKCCTSTRDLMKDTLLIGYKEKKKALHPVGVEPMTSLSRGACFPKGQ